MITKIQVPRKFTSIRCKTFPDVCISSNWCESHCPKYIGSVIKNGSDLVIYCKGETQKEKTQD